MIRLTTPRSPTTTGKIGRLRQMLHQELLNVHGPLADIEDAQAAVDAGRKQYDTDRPHQSLAMASRCLVRPHHPAMGRAGPRARAAWTASGSRPCLPRPATSPVPAARGTRRDSRASPARPAHSDPAGLRARGRS
ncbi:integrase core domain-containing protein [Trebonia sp.]|uniref:integrase core domain-containing protein n=1 Tax=Trebonia sp. TaxID=2767075 RepID=UPI00345BAA4F